MPADTHIACDCVNAIRSTHSSLNLLTLWHNRLGHRNYANVSAFLKQYGINAPVPASLPFCEGCARGKSQRYPLSRRVFALYSAPRPGYLLHGDFAGPFPVPTRGEGFTYVSLLVDDVSSRLFVELTTTTGSFLDIFKSTVLVIEAEFGRSNVVARFHADGASYSRA